MKSISNRIDAPTIAFYGAYMLKPRLSLIAILLVLLVLFSSCTQRTEILHILSDRSELAAAAEIYNAENENVIVLLHQVSTIDAQIVEREKPDIVIGRDLNTLEILKLMTPVSTANIGELSFLSTARLSDVTGKQAHKDDYLLLPLSYELPLIMGKSQQMASLSDPSTVTIEELKLKSDSYAERDRTGRLVKVGFSPSWNPLSFLDLLEMREAGLFASGIPDSDEKALNQVLDEAKLWIEDAAGSVDADREFTRRYRYMPDERLLEDGRILYARTDFESWAKLPDSISSEMDLRYLKGSRTIPVVSMIWAGIPRSSKAEKTAAIFLQWLSRAETQSRLIKRWEQDGLSVFGFLGGLSTNQKVNQTTVLEHFPSMKGMIPETDHLSVPSLIPHRWKRIRNEVITPWFREAIANRESAGTLSDRYRNWDLSSLDASE